MLEHVNDTTNCEKDSNFSFVKLMQLALSSGTFLAVVLRYARKTLELRQPFGKRATNLRRFENVSGASSPMREVSLAQPNKDFFLSKD
jgi:hypothetical protein